MKVLYMVNVPAPYMVSYFNELGKYCDLTVIFEKDTSTERDESWRKYAFTNFQGIILRGISTAPDMALCPQVIRFLKKGRYDYIISSAMTTPTGMIAIGWMKMMGIPYYLESEGGFAKDGKGPKERLKRAVMSGAEGYFSTTPVGDRYFMTYGAPQDRICKYPFTSLYRKDLLDAPPVPAEKDALRKELGLPEQHMLLTVGQFIPRKGFDILLRAAKNIPADTGVCFVGGVPTDEYRALAAGNERIHFVGFRSKEELALYYRAADIFVLPTREDIWGLVINEAMAYGLPVITTDRCIAGLELVDERNGQIIRTDSEKELTDAVTRLLSKETDRMQMGRASLERIQWYTFESMAKVHMDFFKRHSRSGQ